MAIQTSPNPADTDRAPPIVAPSVMAEGDAARIEPTRDGLPPMPPGPPHEETHLTTSATVRDLVVGTADGLILPFALAAALVGAGAANPMIAAAGLAGVVAAGLAKGLGGTLAGRASAEHYAAERRREEEESRIYPDREKWEVAAILHRYGVRGAVLRQSVDAIASDRKKWVDFMMRFELDLTEPDPRRATISAVTVGAAYAAGGLVPLAPYFLLAGTGEALFWSCALTGVALLGFGWLKARATGLPPIRGASQNFAIGGLVAAVAYGVARLLGA